MHEFVKVPAPVLPHAFLLRKKYRLRIHMEYNGLITLKLFPKAVFSVVLYLFLLIGNTSAQILNSIEVEFSRTIRTSSTEQVSSGMVFFHQPDDLKMLVTDPIKQWMVFKDNQLEIYYPDDKRAFRITTLYPTGLPFFEAFAGVIKEDFGLSGMGYTTDSHRTEGDTLLVFWNPPEELADKYGQYVLGFVDNKITYAEARDTKGKATARSIYTDHIKHGGIYFPAMIKITKYAESDSTVETVTYTNPKFDQALPPDVINFKIPDDISIEELEW
ncbi:MAG: hypothetical protein GY839_21725 [candidate division Zixibacteria bacterium]|nr:hypothetical protein [candidate division Zixibacteria bacterium]